MSKLAQTALALALVLSAPAAADAPLFIVEPSQLPFDLGPGAPGNSPNRVSNRHTAAANSAANPGNSSETRRNSPTNPENEKRVVFTSDGRVVGYYVTSTAGVLNIFDVNGRRVAYRPARGTRSLFSSQGRWCGTVSGTVAGGLALGMTRECAARLGW
ncbi:MAG: hypothetical protein Q4G24_12150 [Paracoccus sp. (in: a-proteobacteria)]|uniref:hypothetical protein n=1 Tax=Paracoccus sp. TaxID=267 RepID=UPI0026DEDBFD|nr:hypothetical protein [Paracoccus sp. (in: a-proteobacteria)]MDO5622210.1 hypothetical protein [Paracoccus sp. (in: a-proteobacteria)]